MTLGTWEWIVAIGLPLVLGSGLLRLFEFRLKEDVLAAIGWAWMAGAAATGLVLFAFLLAGASVRGPVVGGAVAALSIGVWVMSLRRGRRGKGMGAAEGDDGGRTAGRARRVDGAIFARPVGGRVERAVWAIVVAAALLSVVDRAVQANRELVTLGDEANIWASKAKVAFISGGFNEEFRKRTREKSIVFHKDYPLLNPMLQVWIFSLAGEVTHVDNRVPLQVSMVALMLVLAGALRRRARPGIAAVLLAVFIFSPLSEFLSMWAYADHLVALGFLAALDGWLRHREGDERGWRLMWFGVAFMAAAKNEAYLLMVAMAFGFGALALVEGLRRPRRLLWCALPAGVVIVQIVFNHHFGFTNDLADHDLAGRLKDPATWTQMETFRGSEIPRWRAVLTGTMETLLHHPLLAVGKDKGVWHRLYFDPPIGRRLAPTGYAIALGILALFAFPRRIWRAGLVAPMMTILAAVVGFYLVYIGTFQPLEWHMETSMARVHFDILPAAMLWAVAAFSAITEQEHDRRSKSSRIPVE